MKKDDSNDFGAKGALSDDSLTQVSGGGLPELDPFTIPIYIMKCRGCDWEKSGGVPSVLLGLAKIHKQNTGHETYFSS